jgi:hypothetical protein
MLPSLQQNEIGTSELDPFTAAEMTVAGHPPAQIRACATNALGSYLEYLPWNRWFGHGCSTRGDGRNRLISRIIRSHVSRCRWLRRRRLRNQMMLVSAVRWHVG